MLKDDEDLKDVIPITCDDENLYHALSDGVVLCKLVALIDPEGIDLRVMKNQKNMDVFTIQTNLNLAIKSV
jgi:hypothetical protein